MDRLYVCGYTHCLHPNEKSTESGMIVVGKKRFHKDCAEVREYIETMKTLYFDKIDDKANYVEVVSVLNNIVFKKGVDPRYMIFAIKYIIKKRARMKSPYSLHYLPTNKLIINQYNKENGENI